MNKQQILEKAIQKAIDGGWEHAAQLQKPNEWTLYDRFPAFSGEEQIDLKHPFIELEGTDDYFSIKELLFDHDFAKALWGEELFDDLPHLRQHIPSGWTSYALKPEWQYHLQQMVIADDPIEYLGENI